MYHISASCQQEAHKLPEGVKNPGQQGCCPGSPVGNMMLLWHAGTKSLPLQKETYLEVGWNRQFFVISFKEETPHIFIVSASSLPIFSV